MDLRSAPHAGFLTKSQCRSHDKIALVSREPLVAACHLYISRRRDRESVVQRDRLEYRTKIVKTVRPAADDLQMQVDLRERRQ
jgi:hypothetical protein